MATVDFIPASLNAIVGTNLESQADYASDSRRTNGEQTGIASSARFNKISRQSTFIASVIANFMATNANTDVLDDGDLAGKITILQNAILQLTSIYALSSSLTAEIDRASSAESLLAPIYSPSLTGSPNATNASPSENSTRIATTAFVKQVLQVDYSIGEYSGYINCPGWLLAGIQIRWGVLSIVGSGKFTNSAFTFVQPFSNNCFLTLATPSTNSTHTPTSSGNNIVAIAYGGGAAGQPGVSGGTIRIDSNGADTLSGSYNVFYLALGN